MEKQPLFSVLIANYNNGRYITKCLDSILKQEYPNIEVIIVDDASTDNSLAVIDGYFQKTNIKLFKNKENKGVGYTKKRCIDEAKGEILGFVDPDDAITENAIKAMVEAHQLWDKATLIYSNYYECNEYLDIQKTSHSKQVINGNYSFLNEDGDIGHFSTFKKTAYLKTKGINPDLKNAEDQDLYFKLYDIGDAVFLNECLYYYRIHYGGLSSLANANHSYFWRWKVIFKRAEEKEIDIEGYFWQNFARRDSIRYWLKIDSIVRQNWLHKTIKKVLD